MTSPRLGPDALLDAATVLFADRGIDAVSIGDITRASGHRNRRAVAYHFGSKDLLMKALVERAIAEPDQQRAALLDDLEQRNPTPSIRELSEVSVGPMTASLADEAGRRNLRLLGQLVGHPRHVTFTRELMAQTSGIGRCLAYVPDLLRWLPEPNLNERFRVVPAFIVRAYADQARLKDLDPAAVTLDDEAFGRSIVDLSTALWLAPATAPDGTTITPP